MNIGLLINDVTTELPKYATTSLAMAAARAGHRVWYIAVEDFAHDPDDKVSARAVGVPEKKFRSGESMLSSVRGEDAAYRRLPLAELDVLMLRNDPADDSTTRPWAQSVGIIFGQLAVQEGVLVLNDPHHLADALNKLYFQRFPAEYRPRTLITRSRDEVQHFVKEEDGKVVLKPLAGSGGQNVFLVQKEDHANLNQIFDAISRDGYVVVQEYLPAAAEGDLRLFLMNGSPLEVNGKYAAFMRRSAKGDLRSNIHAGGHVERAKVTDRVLEIAAAVRPRVVSDGMFLVGLDIAGDKLMEVNVFSPGGLHSMQELEGEDFAGQVIRSIEHKVEHKRRYGHAFDNAELATI